MRCYANNFSTTLTYELTADKIESPLGLDTQSTERLLELIPESTGRIFMRLTLQNADASQYELIDVYSRYGESLSICRAGMENTKPAAWPEGTRVLCAPTGQSFTGSESTYCNDRQSIKDHDNLVIDIRNGKTQILPVADGDDTAGLPIVFYNMRDGDELLLEVQEAENVNQLPAFLNAMLIKG